MTETYNSRIKPIVELPDREDAYYRLVSLYVEGPEQLREEIRSKWDFGVDWTYPDQTRLACSKNEKRSIQERIMASLVYDAIEDLRQEGYREKLVALAVIYQSCIAAGLDPEEEFEKVASISSPRTALFLKEFIERDPEDKSMKAFMLTRKINSDGEIEILAY
jgi:hypothetical protein